MIACVHDMPYVHAYVNTPKSMNNEYLTKDALEEALAKKLQELLGQVKWLHDWHVERVGKEADHPFDLLVNLPSPAGGQVALCVECKIDFRPSMFPLLMKNMGLPSGYPKMVVRVLALPFISRRVADLCKEYGWSWFDLAGNHFLDAPGIFRLQSTGQATVLKPLRSTANLSTPEAGRVIRALLHPEHTGKRWTQRYLAEHFGVLKHPIRQPSLGLVNKIIRYLREEAFIDEEPTGGFMVRDPLKLLFAWRDAYRFDRHERRGYFTLLQGNKLREKLALLGLYSGGFALYASFSAAEVQAPHVRQSKTWLYMQAQQIAQFEELVEAKQVDSGDNLVVLIPDDEGVFYLGDGGNLSENRLACTNEVQTYVDLCYCGGRGQEAAEAVLEQCLKPKWIAKG